MRKQFLTVATIIAAAGGILALAAPAAAGGKATLPGSVGEFSYNAGGGYRVTVGYLPCGVQRDDGTTTGIPTMFAQVRKGGGWTFTAYGVSADNVDNGLAVIGLSLTADARATLEYDAANYTCGG